MGRVLWTGLFFGDVLATGACLARHPRETWLQCAAEFALFAVVWLWAQGDIAWPADAPSRAVVCLAALGVLASRIGGDTLLHRDQSGFA